MLFMVLASQSRSTFTKQGSSTVAAKRKCVTGHTGPGTWPGCHLHCRYTQARFRIPNCTWVRRKIFFTGSSCCCSIYACVIVLLCSYFKYVCKALLCIVRINWKYTNSGHWGLGDGFTILLCVWGATIHVIFSLGLLLLLLLLLLLFCSFESVLYL